MAQGTGRVSVVKATEEDRARWDWTTVPAAHSPQGFADLPYPWHKAKETALKARQAVQDGTVTALKRKDRPDRAAALVPGPETLPEMAARLGASTGHAESRQAELFHLLLEPRRDSTRQIVALTGQAADPAAAKASCRLWLEYFPKAALCVLGAAELPAQSDDRLTAHRLDCDDRIALAARAAALAPPEIVFDDAGHASPCQQDAFLALFPVLKPGGLYIVRGLPRKSAAPEHPGITRTADLFRGFSETRTFGHADPVLEAGFTALAGQIAGVVLFHLDFDRKRGDQVAVIQKR